MQVRFVLVGVACALLLPFIMTFMVFFFFLRYAEEFHRKQSTLGQRDWCAFDCLPPPPPRAQRAASRHVGLHWRAGGSVSSTNWSTFSSSASR